MYQIQESLTFVRMFSFQCVCEELVSRKDVVPSVRSNSFTGELAAK